MASGSFPFGGIIGELCMLRMLRWLSDFSRRNPETKGTKAPIFDQAPRALRACFSVFGIAF